MRRETQNVLLVLLGGALLKIAFTGAYVRYVKPSLLPWLVAAGVVIVLLAAFSIVSDIRAVRREADDAPESGAGTRDETGLQGGAGGDVSGHEAAVGHEHGSRSPWMLLLPVFAIFLIAPPALGADSVARSGDRPAFPVRPRTSSMFNELPRESAPLLEVSEFVTRVVWDDSGALNGRAVRLQGFVVHPADAPPGATQLARMRISCCAADAAPIRVDLAGPNAAEAGVLPADTWIEVTGTLRPGTATEANGQTPTFEVAAVREIPVPADPYEY